MDSILNEYRVLLEETTTKIDKLEKVRHNLCQMRGLYFYSFSNILESNSFHPS